MAKKKIIAKKTEASKLPPNPPGEASKPQPNPPGAPTKYDPSFCEMLVKHMSKGLSYESFAAIVNVCRDTLYAWEKAHVDFSYSKKRSLAKSLLWWEEIGIEGLFTITEKDSKGNTTTKALNTANWIFQMKNRHEWSDKRDLKLQTNDGSEAEKDKIRKMSMEELKKYIDSMKEQNDQN